MVEKKTWKVFRESGILWWANMILHTFGWAIVIEIENEEIVNAYPARVKYRGFGEQVNTDGYIKVSKYIAENANELKKEAES